MERINCKLIFYSLSEHLNQICTGFGALEKQGIINLEIERDADFRSSTYLRPFCKLIINNSINVIIDNSDSYRLRISELDDIDYYFKRIFKADYIKDQDKRVKFYPYGFNYEVFGDNDHLLKRAFWSRDIRIMFRTVLKNNGLLSSAINLSSSKRSSSQQNFEGSPIKCKDPKVLFIARLWKPENVDNQYAKDERDYINEMRASCIELLRAEFGKSFVGGLVSNEYAEKNYPHLVIKSRHLTNKTSYLKRMHKTSICIATTGLLGSVGWKMAEYIAASKAIISEEFEYEFPGDFKEGQNYLSFKTAEECVEQAVFLRENDDIRFQMMQNNNHYYHHFLKPEKLIGNLLNTILVNEKKKITNQF